MTSPSTQSSLASIDPTDPEQWGAAVERMAESIAGSTWGVSHWYRGVANAALTAAFPHLDPKDTQRVMWVYHNCVDEREIREANRDLEDWDD